LGLLTYMGKKKMQ